MSVKVIMHEDVLRKTESELSREYLPRIANDILADAQQAAPVKTGRLRDSGEVREASGDRWEVVFTVDYAAYVELGTKNTHAQPFLLPAATKRRTI